MMGARLKSYRDEGRNLLDNKSRTDLIKQVRTVMHMGVSQSEIARRAGVHPSTVSRLIARGKVTVAYGDAIARAATDVRRLLGGR